MRTNGFNPLARILVVISLISGLFGSGFLGLVEVSASPNNEKPGLQSQNQLKAAVSSGKYDDMDLAWSYKGNWKVVRSSNAFNGQTHDSTRSNDNATITMIGSAFTLVYTTGPTRGAINVFVDGKKIASINQHSTNTVYQKSWKSPNLASRQHLLKFVHANGKSIDIDMIMVSGTDQPPRNTATAGPAPIDPTLPASPTPEGSSTPDGSTPTITLNTDTQTPGIETPTSTTTSLPEPAADTSTPTTSPIPSFSPIPPTSTDTSSPTPTASQTLPDPTVTFSPTPSPSPTLPNPTATDTATPTATYTSVPTNTPNPTPTFTPIPTNTPNPTSTQISGLTRPMKYYGVDRGSPFTDSNYATLAQHSVKTIIVDTFINDSSNSSSARWSNIKSLAAKYNFNYVIWPDQGGDVAGCGWEDPFNSPVNGYYIGRVTTMLDSFSSDPHFVGLVSSHEPMWNVSTCKTSIPDLVAIKSQLKSYMTSKGRADFRVWAYIDNITDLANMSGYVPQDIQDVMDVAVTWQHCFGGAEGSCAAAKNKIIADRALINKAGLDGKVDLVYLFQTFGMSSGSGYTMPTLSDMQTWDCQFISTNALDGFMYYTWGAWYATDLLHHPELWPEMNRVYDSCTVH